MPSKILTLLAFLAVFSYIGPSSGLSQTTGKQLYETIGCVSCHGTNAGGNKKLRAPPIAGQDAVYLERQLKNFKYGARGYSTAEIWGVAMANVAKYLADDDITLLAGYLNSLPPVNNPATLQGNPLKGAESFQICAACHTAQGTGNPALNAPNLMILDDWYVAEQLLEFREGLRGIPEKDLIGATMAPNALILADDAAVKDVAVYIRTLRNINWNEKVAQK